jgi:negative regulator of flagellin synthesis FlgM
MSIERLSAESASRTYVQQAQLSRANSAAAGDATSGDKAAAQAQSRVDTVTLSSNAKSLAAARDAVQASDGDIRHDKVADIKQRIGDGTYQVDARVLARKMLSNSGQ